MMQVRQRAHHLAVWTKCAKHGRCGARGEGRGGQGAWWLWAKGRASSGKWGACVCGCVDNVRKAWQVWLARDGAGWVWADLDMRAGVGIRQVGCLCLWLWRQRAQAWQATRCM